jgi:hypothetical protein
MKMNFALRPLVVVIAFASFCLAQQPPNTREAQLAAMKKLSRMAGTWTGTGSMQMGANDHRESKVTESIQPKLDGLLLVVDGIGKNAAGDTVHQAFGVISYDGFKNEYKFAAYTKEGYNVLADAKVEGNQFIWSFDTRGASIRYTATVTNDEWVEVGERSTDKQTWVKFFEMKLKKGK